jgi:hypothetical protein
MDHEQALRALLARVFVAPAFLYRIEQSSGPLNGFELASRMSYFLWSSMPDEELRRAAQAGELNNPPSWRRRCSGWCGTRRRSGCPRSFSGSGWASTLVLTSLRGWIRAAPEFTADVKAGMYAEAVAFFDHIVRQNRPVKEILTADYTFLNQPLAKHYGVTAEVKSAREVEMVKGVAGRGGLLRSARC